MLFNVFIKRNTEIVIVQNSPIVIVFSSILWHTEHCLSRNFKKLFTLFSNDFLLQIHDFSIIRVSKTSVSPSWFICE